MTQLEDLLQQCTVKLTLPGCMGWGTGFFVAPEWILTCTHVVQEAKGQPIQVRWQNQENWAQAVVERSLPDPYDLALLRVTLPTDAEPHCVYLDATIQPRDPLYLFGYPDQDFPNGCPVTFSCEGLTGDKPAYIDASQVKPTVKKILMLSANPENPETVRRRKETKEIRDALKRAKHGDLCEPLERSDINAAELSQELSTIEPYIIDISGCDNGIEGLTLEGNLGINTFKNPEKLIADLFEFHAKSVQCIILNSCYSDVQAREIVQHIEFVIGISRELEEIKVIEFLSEFYYQLGSERTIRDSYNLSCNYLQRRGLEDINLLPTLLDKYNEKKRRELEKCDKEIEKNQDNVELWKKKASLLTELGRDEEANEAYEKASSLDAYDYTIRAKQGDALELSGQPEKAVNAYDKALELEQEDYKVWWKKGRSLVKVEKYDEAVESYNKAVALAAKLEQPSPDRYIICREYASLLKKLGEYQKSIAMYKKSLGFEPKYRASSYLKRQVYKKMYSGQS